MMAAMIETAPVETSSVVRSLAALGHDARLAIFRLLVRAGPNGLNVGEIGAHLGIAPSTLAHHLAALAGAGLVVQERRGRETVNRVDFAALRRTLDFLTDECCAGLPALSEPARAEPLP
jgi:DNA-binding transcriptional ArsR family regulator